MLQPNGENLAPQNYCFLPRTKGEKSKFRYPPSRVLLHLRIKRIAKRQPNPLFHSRLTIDGQITPQIGWEYAQIVQAEQVIGMTVGVSHRMNSANPLPKELEA
jgi:hypothetical protein